MLPLPQGHDGWRQRTSCGWMDGFGGRRWSGGGHPTHVTARKGCCCCRCRLLLPTERKGFCWLERLWCLRGGLQSLKVGTVVAGPVPRGRHGREGVTVGVERDVEPLSCGTSFDERPFGSCLKVVACQVEESDQECLVCLIWTFN